jgi:hypothetical protein
MAFDRGSVSYARFRVDGGPDAVSSEVLEALAANVLTPPGIGAPPEVQTGWVAGRHVYDTDFDPALVAYGDDLLFGLRLDVSRVPAELRRAYRAMAEAARAPGGTDAGRANEREAREEAEDRCREELATGRHTRSRLIPIVWNVPGRTLLAPVFTDVASVALRDLFAATFDAQLEPYSSGTLAAEMLAARGRSRDHEDIAPSSFTPSPPAARAEEGRAVDVPVVPWTLTDPAAKDFLGNELIVWLWAQSEIGNAVVETERGAVAFVIDRSLDMDCAWQVTGRQMLRADGPTRLPEALVALRTGKWPRKVGLILAADGEEWTLALQGDRFLVSGARLPRPAEPPASPREAIEQRMSSIAALDAALVDLYRTFLDRRTASGWSSERARISEWIQSLGATRRPAPAAAAVAAE